MSQKFYDIIPPQQIKKSFDEKKTDKTKSSRAPHFTAEEEKISEKTENGFDLNNFQKEGENMENNLVVSGTKKTDGLFRKLFLLIFIIGAIIALIYGFKYYENSASVEIKIRPKAEVLSLKGEIVIDDKIVEPDFSKKLFPMKIFNDQKIVSQDFSVLGKGIKEEKAKGIIRIYNSFSTQSQSLVAQTRFVSADGKLFKSLQKIVVPGGKYEKNKLVPGEINVEVQAALAGEEYNIGPSTFSIPGLLGTSKYTAFYGKSLDSMKGGFKGEAPQVSSDDLNKARESLTSKAQKEGLDSLKTKVPQDYILLEKTSTFEIINETSSAKVGSFVDSFNFKETVKTEGLALKVTDVDKLVKSLISSDALKGKKIEEKNIQINFSPKKKENGKLPVNLEISAKVIPELDVDEFKKAIAGKSMREINFLLKDNLQSSKIEIKSSTFWLRKIPENLNNIKIEIIVQQ